MGAWHDLDRPALMAVVNLNDDSFSDPRGPEGSAGAAPSSLDERLAGARAAVAAGADLVDLGAQSAALDAALVNADEQQRRLVPVTEALAAEGVVVSVDTYDPAVARAVLAAGASVLNDFSGTPDRGLVESVAERGAWYVLTHNPVGPRRRQTDADFFVDVVDETIAELVADLERLERWGLPREKVVVDPGVDVGKTPAQSLELLRGRKRIAGAFDAPVLWAISRKDVLGAITGRPPSERDPGTLALLAAVAELPRTVVRVHDVAGCRDHLRVLAALRGELDLDPDGLLHDHLRRET